MPLVDHPFRPGVCKDCGRPYMDHVPTEEERDALYEELAKSWGEE